MVNMSVGKERKVSMFGKEDESVPGEGKMNSIIGKGCKVNGTVDIQEGTIRVDGEFEGTLNCPATLYIGKSGRVKANVNVKNAIVGGKVLGNIAAKNKIELQAGSRVEGDLKTSRLVIDEGVFFEGSCKMSPDGKTESGMEKDKVGQPSVIKAGLDSREREKDTVR
jgi:cytoskeletal protein CcmA (bactofilin family)